MLILGILVPVFITQLPDLCWQCIPGDTKSTTKLHTFLHSLSGVRQLVLDPVAVATYWWSGRGPHLHPSHRDAPSCRQPQAVDTAAPYLNKFIQ